MSATKDTLELLIRVNKQGDGFEVTTDGLDKVEQKTKKVKQSSEALNKTMMAVQGAAIAGGVAFLKSIPALVDYGLQAERGETALIAYAGSAEEAEAAVAGIREVTKGSLSTFEATENATRLFSMGLADTADEAAHLTEIATTLGAAMGKEAGSAFEDFSLMLANQSIPRLDTFGISASAVRKRIAELQEETEGLSREQAFMIATTEIADQKLASLEEQGFQAVSSVDRLSAAFKDGKLAAARFFADGLMPIIDGLFALRDASKEHQESVIHTTESYDDYTNELLRAYGIAGLQAGQVKVLSEAEWEAARATKQEAEALEAVSEATQTVIEDTNSLILSEEDAKAAMQNLQTLMAGDLTESYEDIKEKKQDLIDKAIEIRKKLTEIDWSTEDAQREYEELHGKLHDTTDAIAEVEEAWDKQTKEMLFDLAAQTMAVDGMTQEEMQFLSNLAGPQGFGLIDQAYADMMNWVGEAITVLDEEGNQVNYLMDDFRNMQGVMSDTSRSTDAYTDSLNRIPSSKTTNVHTVYTYSGNHPGGSMDPYRHDGGPVMAGFPYIVKPDEEIFWPDVDGYVAPADSVSMGGRLPSAGESVPPSSPVIVQYSPLISLATRDEAERVLAPLVESAIRKSRANKYG